MKKETFELEAIFRSDKGKGASRRLRRQKDLIPAIIYGAGKEPVLIALAHNKVWNALENEVFYSHILALKTDGKEEKVILKDLQRHPFRKIITHMDFQRIKADEKLRMTIPLHFIGEEVAPGVKIDGGMISHLLSEVEITCFPADLPEYIEVDLSAAKLNQMIHLSDLKLPKGVGLVANVAEAAANLPIASVHLPRAAEEIEEAAPAAAVETEIINEVKPEEKAEEEKGKEKEKEKTKEKGKKE